MIIIVDAFMSVMYEIDQLSIGGFDTIIANKFDNQAHLMLLKPKGLPIPSINLYLCLICAIFFSILDPKM